MYAKILAVVFLGLGVVSGIAQARPKITSVSHLSIYTSDASKSDRYYGHDLGGMKAPDPQNPQGVRYYFNALQFVEVLPLPSGAGTNRLDHVGYNVSDAEAMRKYLATQKIDIPAEVSKSSDGAKYFEIKDPEGNRIQFIQPPAKPATVPKNTLSDHIIHVGYIVHDYAKELGWYQSVLGFRPYWHGGRNEDSHDWNSAQVPDGMDWVELMLVADPSKTTQASAGVLNHMALGVPNIENTMTKMFNEDKLSAKHSQPQIGRDAKWQLNFYDDEGTRTEFMEFQPIGKPCCSPFLLPSPTK